MAFDFRVAELLARASAFSYSDDHDAPAELSAPDRPKVTKIANDGSSPTSFATVLEYSDKIIVAYRGTRFEFADWIQNFRAAFVGALGGHVHAGFYDELTKVQTKVVGVVKPNGRPVYVTGHSQGGAVAALATAAFATQGIIVTETYTFAAPRPGNSAFRQAIRTPVHRVEIGNDIVPHVPPALGELPAASSITEMLFTAALAHAPRPLRDVMRLASSAVGYEAVGSLCYGLPGEFVIPDVTPEQERHLFRGRLKNLFAGQDTLVKHHDISNYVAAVDRF